MLSDADKDDFLCLSILLKKKNQIRSPNQNLWPWVSNFEIPKKSKKLGVVSKFNVLDKKLILILYVIAEKDKIIPIQGLKESLRWAILL